jgi:hypothetical protein
MIGTYKTHIKEGGVYIIKNLKVQEASNYRLLSNNLKIIFIYTTSVKEVKQSSIKFHKYHFEFATKDVLMERENNVLQCSGKNIIYNGIVFLD